MAMKDNDTASGNLFTQHPKEVGLSYLGHMKFALWVTSRLAYCTFACLVHALFPFWFTHTVSEVLADLGSLFKEHS